MMKLFGTDGVRARAGCELDGFTALRLAMAAGIYLKANAISSNILVGKDTRKSGYMIESAIVAGLTSVGFNVTLIGPMPTPAIAFLTEDLRCDAGIMISASHNPYFDNGIKFFDSFGQKFCPNQEAQIESIYHDEALINANKVSMDKIGKAKRIDDVIGRYIVAIKHSFPKHLTLKDFRIVLDVANGAAYKVAPTVFSELGAEVFVLNNEPNGININDNCGALFPAHLASEVLRLRADVGFAFDGDADRLVVVDEEGKIAHGDVLLGVLALFLKQTGRLRSKVVSTLMSNACLKDFLSKHSIEYERADVGDKHVLKRLKELGANFGGEQSGHIIFSDYAKTGDALVASLLFCALLLFEKNSACKVLSKLYPYPQLLRNIKVKERKDLSKIKGLNELEAKLDSQGFSHLFRYSGTEKLLRLMLEHKDAKKLEAKMDEVENFFLDRI